MTIVPHLPRVASRISPKLLQDAMHHRSKISIHVFNPIKCMTLSKQYCVIWVISSSYHIEIMVILFRCGGFWMVYRSKWYLYDTLQAHVPYIQEKFEVVIVKTQME